jgi:hypothetical protein
MRPTPSPALLIRSTAGGPPNEATRLWQARWWVSVGVQLDRNGQDLLLHGVFIGFLCRWAATPTDTLEQHLQPALDLVMPLLGPETHRFASD